MQKVASKRHPGRLPLCAEAKLGQHLNEDVVHTRLKEFDHTCVTVRSRSLKASSLMTVWAYLQIPR